MRYLGSLILLLVFAFSAYAGDTPQPKPETKAEEVVFSDPFTLKLYVDKEHYYEESYGRIPYVHHGDIYLFSGESFGVDVKIRTTKL